MKTPLYAAASRVTINGGTVTTNASGADGLFATGSGTTITMTGGSIETTKTASHGIDVTYGGTINLTNTTVTTSGDSASAAFTVTGGATISASSGNLVNADSGSTVTFTEDRETLKGNVMADSTSTMTAVLKNSTSLSGAFQGAGISLDSTSTWTVTATSALTTLADPAGISGSSITNIVGNGFTVSYVANLAANSALGGKTYALVNGGQLVPK